MKPKLVVKRAARALRDELKSFTSGQPPLRGRRVCWPSPGRVTIEDFNLSGVGSSMLAIQNAVTLISPGTERAYFLNEPNIGIEFPYYPGYASAGTVILAGKNTPFRPGDRIASRTVHASLETMDGDRAVAIPEGVSFDEAAFCQIAIISLQGVRQAQIQPDDRVLVIGRGPIGVIAKRLAECCGSTSVDLAGTADILQAPGAGSYDVVMEVSGKPDAMLDALAAVREGGSVVLLGSPRHAAHNVDFAAAVTARRIRLVSAHGGNAIKKADGSGARTWAEEATTILELIAAKRLQVSDLVTERVAPDTLPQFYANLASGKRTLGALIDWSKEPSPIPKQPTAAAKAGRAVRRIVAAARNPKASSTKMSNPLRVGLIGCGEIGMANARALTLASSTVLVHASDPNEQTAADLAGRFGVPYSNDPQETLLRPDVEAVFICVPHFLHAPLAIAAAKAGKHVIVEKPMATSAADAQAMIDAAREAGVLLSVCFCTRYEPHIQRAAELIRAGALGEITATKVTYEEEKSAAYWTGGHSGRVKSTWRGRWKESGGGVLIMNICHYLDQLRYLTALEPTHIFAEYGTMIAPVEVEDHISMTYRYSNGAIGTVLASTGSRGGGGRDLRISGRDGQLVLSGNCRFYSIHSIEGLPARKWHEFGKLPEVDERVRYAERFGQAVRNGWAADISGEDGLMIQKLVDAAYQAGRNGSGVELNEMVGAL